MIYLKEYPTFDIRNIVTNPNKIEITKAIIDDLFSSEQFLLTSDIDEYVSIVNYRLEMYYHRFFDNHEFHTYTKADIFWYAEWALDNCKILFPELYKKIIKGLKLTKESGEIYQYYFFRLHELQNIRYYTLRYYHTLNHDQPDRKRSVEESIALCRLDEKIEFLEEWKNIQLKIYLEGEKRMKKVTESENNACDKSIENLHPITPAERISCKCDYITCNICNSEKELVYVIKECIKQQYDVNYNCVDVNTFKGYITHGELINYVETDETKFYITIHTPADEGNLVIDMLSEINLKTIKFENNILYISNKK